MKKTILILGIILCGIQGINAQNSLIFPNQDKEKTIWLNAGLGFGFPMGTFLFPSVNASVLAGPLEFEGFWKYSEYHGIGLHTWAVGADLFLFKIGYNSRFLLNYNYLWDAETDLRDVSTCSYEKLYVIDYSDGHVFNVGIQGKLGTRSEISFKLGVMYNPDIVDKLDPRMELHFQWDLRKVNYGRVFLFNIRK